MMLDDTLFIFDAAASAHHFAAAFAARRFRHCLLPHVIAIRAFATLPPLIEHIFDDSYFRHD